MAQRVEGAPEVDASPNTPPTIDRLSITPNRLVSGSTAYATVEASDVDNDDFWIQFSWEIDGERSPHTTDQLSLSGVPRGSSVAVTVVATDGRATSEPATESMYVKNAPPRIESVTMRPSREITRGTSIWISPSVGDDDGDATEVEVSWRVNGRVLSEKGATLDTRRFRRGDVVTASVTATDGWDASEPTTLPGILVVNSPPRIVSAPPPDAGRGGEFRYSAVVEDADQDPFITFSLAEAPQGMEIDAVSGDVRWRPDVDQVGIHTVRIVADDGHGASAEQTFAITTDGGPVISVAGR